MPEPTTRQTMNFKEYGKHREVSGATLSLYIKKGILPRGAWEFDDRGKYVIFVEEADAVLNSRTHGNLKAAKEQNGTGPQPMGEEAQTAVNFAKSRAAKEAVNAKLLHMELQEKEKTLVRADDVRKEGFELARTLREQIFNIPARISAILAAESSPRKVSDILTKELRQAFEAIDKQFRPDGK